MLLYKELGDFRTNCTMYFCSTLVLHSTHISCFSCCTAATTGRPVQQALLCFLLVAKLLGLGPLGVVAPTHYGQHKQVAHGSANEQGSTSRGRDIE